MCLPLVNFFEQAYEAWNTRQPTVKELKEHLSSTGVMLYFVNTSLKERIETHFDAARYILEYVEDNAFESDLDHYLNNSAEFQNMLNKMPNKMPCSIETYKERYYSSNLEQVSMDINDFGSTLRKGQYLFHGGFCLENEGKSFYTNRPLSASFCPQVALRNAEWMGKAYDAGEVHLFVLNVVKPETKVYVFSMEGELGNEKEVLFSAGAKLKIIKKTLISNNYKVYKYGGYSRTLNKEVPAYVVEIDIT
uniref:ADP ribosyltransferase domain-containing protein n=1 Tax=Aliivibrio wodanis TaxID=80852 RepID=A0A5Q4ZSH8_9GAMM|nr:hypothetical protein AW0309160_03498 [Aliivibrio wodanis]